jgi:signal recognition particle receptor subunit beta
MAPITQATQTLEILVTGLPNSGKSTFVKTISTRTREAQGWTTGDLNVDTNLQLKLLEPPRVRQFDFMWLRELIEHVEVPAFIVVCDSTKPEYFGAVVGLLETIHYNHTGVPCVLVTNKDDQLNAWPADDIRIGLGIPDFIDVISCNAKRRADVKRIIVRLLYKILD